MDNNMDKNKLGKNSTSTKKSNLIEVVKDPEKNTTEAVAKSELATKKLSKSSEESSSKAPVPVTKSSAPVTKSTAPIRKSAASIAKSVKSTIPKVAKNPPPDPVFVLRGAPCSISSVQFLSPALRLDELTPAQREVLNASYGPTASGDGGMSLLKLPPPGFLNPTTHIAAGLLNGQIIIWDLKTKLQVLCWQAHPHTSSVLSVKNVSATELVSLGGKDSLKLWYLEAADNSNKSDNAPKMAEYLASVTPVCRVQISLGDYLGFSECDVFRHSNCIVAAVPGDLQDSVSVWSLNQNVKICQLRVEAANKVGSIMQLKWVEKKGTASLAVAYESGDFCLWNWSNKDVYSSTRIDGTPLCLEYDQNLGVGIIGTAQEIIYIYMITNANELQVVNQIKVINESIGCCISRPDSKIYVTGGFDKKIRIFSWDASRLLAVLDVHTKSISCLHYSGSRVACYEWEESGSKGAGPSTAGTEHMLAAGSLDGSISLWKIF